MRLRCIICLAISFQCYLYRRHGWRLGSCYCSRREEKERIIIAHIARARCISLYYILHKRKEERERERINNTLDKPLIAFVIYTSAYIYIYRKFHRDSSMTLARENFCLLTNASFFLKEEEFC